MRSVGSSVSWKASRSLTHSTNSSGYWDTGVGGGSFTQAMIASSVEPRLAMKSRM